jgi:putative transposase
VDRNWDTGTLDRVWTSDITYLPTGQGWVYLCAVRDGCSRRVIGWAMAHHMGTELVTDALDMAVTFRGDRPARVVFHADRGTQPVQLDANGRIRRPARSGLLRR